MLQPALLGLCLGILERKVYYSRFNTKLNKWVAIFWHTLTLSYYAGPYVNVFNAYVFYVAPTMFLNIQKTFLTYYAAVLLLDNVQKLKWPALVLVVIVIYMTYWANACYFIDGAFGRISRPASLSGHGIYRDENIFAVLLVVWGGRFLSILQSFLTVPP